MYRGMLSVLILLIFAGCAGNRNRIPGYLKGKPQELYLRRQGRIVRAPAADVRVARRYA